MCRIVVLFVGLFFSCVSLAAGGTGQQSITELKILENGVRIASSTHWKDPDYCGGSDINKYVFLEKDHPGFNMMYQALVVANSASFFVSECIRQNGRSMPLVQVTYVY